MMAPFSGGGNPSGTSTSAGFNDVQGGPVLGGHDNPFVPSFPSGPNAPPITFRGGSQDNTMGSGRSPGMGTIQGPITPGNYPGLFPANTPPGTGTDFNIGPIGGFSPQQSGLGNIPGMSPQMSQLLYQFLSSGAGFNPQVAQAMIAALQPQIARGEANINEQFASQGLATGSPAAIGLADYMSQVNLNEGQIFAQMYEQSVQNYLSALTLGKTQPLPSGLGALVGGIGQLGQGIGSIIGNWPSSDPSKPTPAPIPMPTGTGGGDGGGGGDSGAGWPF